MIKAFYLINSLALGGAERQMAELVRRLPRDRFDPVLCLLDGTNAYRELLPPDQPRYVVGSPLGPARARRLLEILRAEKPDIVHSFMEYANLWARLLGPLAGRPVVITSVRSRMMRPDYRLVEAVLATRCDAVTVNSVGTRDELVRFQRVPAHKIRLIRNILDLQRFKPATEAKRQEARTRLGLSGTVIVVPGRVSIAKHQLGLCAAVALALKKRLVERGAFTILLAGRVYDSLVANAFSAAVRGLGLQGVFRYLGPVKEVESLYAAADFVMLPSLYEGLPNAALEAHACAVPLLMSHAANLDRIMEPEVTGFEFETGSIGPMASALARAVRSQADERRAMGLEGRKRVLRLFDPESALQDVINLYDELLARKPRGPLNGR